jgi:tetratricopeptide (TPR) repeat protein
VPRLRRLYLGGFATFFLLAFVAAWIVNSRNRLVHDPQTALAILMQDTAKLIEQKRLDRAEKNLAELKKLAPDNPTVLVFSGAIKSLRKDYAGARADYSLALKAAPNSFNAAFNLAEVDFVTKNYPAAATGFLNMLDSRPDDEILLFRLFLCELLQSNDAGADSYLGRIPISGQTPAWYYANAARLFHTGKNSDARKLLNSARILYPDKTAFFDASNQLLGFR